ncbi:MAG TPA: trypsin-like peptidase domain-containing protein, partial [Actinomycetota bacterium]|nr:trypsin-like peptidase domain-containing protein [Actinomycetota bacterium]
MKSTTPSRLLALSAVTLALLLGACTQRSQGFTPVDAAATPLPPISAGSEPFEAVAQHVLPSVVNVTTDVYQASPTGAPEEGRGVGTGFVVGSDGVIVTNCHVVQGASRITVFTSEQDPTRYNARVIG